MNRTIFLFVFVTNICSIVHGQELSKSGSFNVINKIRNIIIDGILEKKEWTSIDSIAGLTAPWSSIGHDQTVFKSFCSDTFFYFCFNVVDKTITTYDFKDELTVTKEDRVELFFSATSDLSQYFCIEMDPLGRINDYSAQYYRKFDRLWNFKQVKITTQYTPQGYIVEGAISLSELKELGIKGSFFLGIFRADYKSTKTDDVVWYSWIDPKRPTPDFHIPAAFGICNLKKR
jgi:hypothetical protein